MYTYCEVVGSGLCMCEGMDHDPQKAENSKIIVDSPEEKHFMAPLHPLHLTKGAQREHIISGQHLELQAKGHMTDGNL